MSFFGMAVEDAESCCRVSGFPQAGFADMRGLDTTVLFFTAAVSFFTLGASAHPSAKGGELTQNVNQGLASVSLHARFNTPLELAGEGFFVG